jgi:hypothetical protein
MSYNKSSRSGSSKQPPHRGDGGHGDEGLPSRPFSLPPGYYDYYGIPRPQSAQGSVQAKRPGLNPGPSLPRGLLEYYGIGRRATSDGPERPVQQEEEAQAEPTSATEPVMRRQTDSATRGGEAQTAVVTQPIAAVRETPTDVFAQATRDGGGEVPYRGEMERAFGQDFSSVRASTGRPREMAGIDAEAATQGERIAFADARPSLHVVAHELAHVVQSRNGGASVGPQARRSGVSDPTDAAEREAEDVATRVAAGERVSVGEPAGPGLIHRLRSGTAPKPIPVQDPRDMIIPEGTTVIILGPADPSLGPDFLRVMYQGFACVVPAAAIVEHQAGPMADPKDTHETLNAGDHFHHDMAKLEYEDPSVRREDRNFNKEYRDQTKFLKDQRDARKKELAALPIIAHSEQKKEQAQNLRAFADSPLFPKDVTGDGGIGKTIHDAMLQHPLTSDVTSGLTPTAPRGPTREYVESLRETPDHTVTEAGGRMGTNVGVGYLTLGISSLVQAGASTVNSFDASKGAKKIAADDSLPTLARNLASGQSQADYNKGVGKAVTLPVRAGLALVGADEVAGVFGGVVGEGITGMAEKGAESAAEQGVRLGTEKGAQKISEKVTTASTKDEVKKVAKSPEADTSRPLQHEEDQLVADLHLLHLLSLDPSFADTMSRELDKLPLSPERMLLLRSKFDSDEDFAKAIQNPEVARQKLRQFLGADLPTGSKAPWSSKLSLRGDLRKNPYSHLSPTERDEAHQSAHHGVMEQIKNSTRETGSQRNVVGELSELAEPTLIENAPSRLLRDFAGPGTQQPATEPLGKKMEKPPVAEHNYPTFTLTDWDYKKDLLPDHIIATPVRHGDVIVINGLEFKVIERKDRYREPTTQNPMGKYMHVIPHLRGG